MSAPIVVPFNYQPVSTTITTSTTISAGQYALVRPLKPTCTMDGARIASSTVISATTNSFIGRLESFSGRIVSSNASATKNILVDYGSTSITLQTVTGTTALDLNFQNGIVLDKAGGVTLAANSPSGLLYVTAGSNIDLEILVFEPTDIWVPTGTVLAGGQWLVQLYNSVT